MKKLKICTILSAFAFGVLLLLSPRMGYADSTMPIKLISVGGQSSQGDYVYPYNFSFDGSIVTTPLMCISYENEIYFGESWTATMTPVDGSDNLLDVEAAYILAQAAAPGASANTIEVAQWANWELFDSGASSSAPVDDSAAITTMLTTAASFAASNQDTTTDFPNIDIFTPIDGTQSTGGLPQTFVGDPKPYGNNDPLNTPEPSSLVLFGSGLLGLAGLIFRKRCIA